MVGLRFLFHVMIVCTMITMISELRADIEVSLSAAIVTVALAIAGTWRKDDE